MPPFLKTAAVRLRALFRRDAVAGEIRDELEFHLAMRIEQYEREGFSHAEARRLARHRIGNVSVHQDRGYDVRGGGFVETVVQDLRYAIRLLRQQPGFTAVAVLTLALGIGGSTAIFSVIDAAVLRPLPFSRAGELVAVTIDDDNHRDGSNHERLAIGPSLTDVRRLAASGAGNVGIASWYSYEERVLIDTGKGTERVGQRQISEGFLGLHGVSPALGRSIEARDVRIGAPAVVVLGYAFWQSRFGADPGVIGRTVRFPNGTAEIIGVAPAGFYRTTAAWRPLTPPAPSWESDRGTGTITYARMRPGMTAAAAAREMTGAMRAQASASGDTSEPVVRTESLYELTTAGSGPTLLMLAGAVSCVLLIACVNVAGLLLARGATRQQEFAVRSSLGAGRGRLVRQLLTEGVVLAGLSGLTAVVLARASINALLSIIPFQIPDNAIAAIDVRALAFAAVLSLGSSIAFALWPAARLSKARIIGAPIAASRHGAPLNRRGTRALVATEVAMAVLLLTGAGLLIRSFAKATDVDLGFAGDSVIVMEAEPLDQRPAPMHAFFMTLLEKLNALPGVAAAGATDLGPFSENRMVGAAGLDVDGDTIFSYATMLPGSVEAVGLTLVDGRWPSAAEFVEPSRVAILNEVAARELSPGRSALGRQLRGFGPPRTVIGIMRDVRQSPLSRADSEIVIPSDRAGEWPLPVVVRPAYGARVSADVLRQIVLSVDPHAFVGHVWSGSALHSDQIATPRQRALLFGLFGVTGLALTLVGIFGVTSYSVARRRTEIGVRMALGARPGQAVTEILREVMWPIVAGAALGLGAATLIAKTLSSFLFETTPNDPWTLTGVVILLTAGGLIAAWLPARRAARIDPVATLRAE